MTKEKKPLFVTYQVAWNFTTKLCASTPANPDLIRRMLDVRAPKVTPPSARSISEIHEEIVETLAEPQPSLDEQYQRTLLVFQRDVGGLVIRASTIRSHLKDCARVISSLYVGKVEGERAFSSRVINGVYPDPMIYWIPITRDSGGRVIEADGIYEKAIHARGPRGEPINALKAISFVHGACLHFRLQVLGGCVNESDLRDLLTYGGVHGYAGERSDGEGKYLFTLEREEIDGRSEREEERAIPATQRG